MKEKKLHISAIIPPELYVQRDADRKLEEILRRMSKPAYVSVSRQMGKTNLLIHAKQKLEDWDHRYVFIDITNQFNSSQDCFRYIIDQILDANEELPQFKEAGRIIKANRPDVVANPTKEYQDELREILRQYSGHLVIFLDEVDDLRKHSFSDEIFAQIRKTYFLRVTYPAFNRLSYVLSGVIDPEKLIKNKDNSPFNIAIPVYLDDFKFSEFQQFVQKSGIQLTEVLQQYLFDWLGGNPRMTFDVLSRLEDEYIQGRQITEALVDDVIYDIYLQNFKHPPIDHIRDIVKHNTDVRKGLIKLLQGKSDELSDDLKNKLYLYGIVGSKASQGELKIKNKVIALSLSREWIEQVELEKSGYYDLGVDRISQKLYDEGIKYLKEYIQNNPKGKFVNLANYDIGRAYHDTNRFDLSNQYLLEKPISLASSADLYYRQVLLIGVNFFKLGDFPNALSYFDEVIKGGQKPQTVMNALVNKGEVLVATNASTEEVEDTYLIAKNYLETHLDVIEEKDRFYTVIYYHLGRLHVGEDNAKALGFLDEALRYAQVGDKPLLYLLKDSAYKNEPEIRKALHADMATFILSHGLEFSSEESVIPFTQYHVQVVLINLIDFGFIDLFDQLFDYTKDVLLKGAFPAEELYYDLGMIAYQSGDLDATLALLERLLAIRDASAFHRQKAYLIMGLIRCSRKKDQAAVDLLNRYIDLFETNKYIGPLQFNDLNAFVHVITYYWQQSKWEQAYRVAKVVEHQFTEEMPVEIRAMSLVVQYYIMDYHNYQGDLKNCTLYAEKNLVAVDAIRPHLSKLSFIDKSTVDHIEKASRKFLEMAPSIHEQILPIKVVREKGRNEWVRVRYKNGREMLAKYKKVKEDIEKGECILLD